MSGESDTIGSLFIDLVMNSEPFVQGVSKAEVAVEDLANKVPPQGKKVEDAAKKIDAAWGQLGGSFQGILDLFGPGAGQVGAFAEKLGGAAEAAGTLGSGIAEAAAPIVGVAVAAAAAGAAMFELANKSADYTEKISVMSRQTGLATQTLVGIDFATQASGKSIDDVRAGIVKFTATLAQADNGNKRAVAGFASLGVSLKDTAGHTRSTDDVLRDTLNALSLIQDPTNRAAEAMRVFGAKGSQVAAILANGSGAIDDWADRAREAGVVVDATAVQAAENLRGAQADLSLATTALTHQLGEDLTPTVVRLVEGLSKLVTFISRDVVPVFSAFYDMINAVTNPFVILDELTGAFAPHAANAGEGAAKLGDDLDGLAASTAASAKEFQQALKAVDQFASKTAAAMESLAVAQGTSSQHQAQAAKQIDELNKAYEKATANLDSMKASDRALADQLGAELDAAKGAVQGAADLKDAHDAQRKSTQAAALAQREANKEATAAAKAQRDLAQVQQHLTQDQDKYNATIAGLQGINQQVTESQLGDFGRLASARDKALEGIQKSFDEASKLDTLTSDEWINLQQKTADARLAIEQDYQNKVAVLQREWLKSETDAYDSVVKSQADAASWVKQQAMGSLGAGISESTSGWLKAITLVHNAASTTWSSFTKDLADPNVSGVTKVVEGFVVAWKGAFSLLKSELKAVFSYGTQLFEGMTGGFLKNFSLSDAVKAASGGSAKGTVDYVDQAVIAAEAFMSKLIIVAPSLVREIGKKLPGLITEVGQLFPVLVNELVPLLPDIANKLITAIVDALPMVAEALASAIPGLVQVFVDNLPTFLDAVIASAGVIVEALLEALIPKLPEIAIDLIKATVKAIGVLVVALVKGLAGGLSNLFGGGGGGGGHAYSGIDYVPATMRVTLHQGEMVLPADRAAFFRGGGPAAPPAATLPAGSGGSKIDLAVMLDSAVVDAALVTANGRGQATGIQRMARRGTGVTVGFNRGRFQRFAGT